MWISGRRNYCKRCGRCYKHKSHLKRHINFECGLPPAFQCPYCGYKCKRKEDIHSHVRKLHSGLEVYVINLRPLDNTFDETYQ